MPDSLVCSPRTATDLVHLENGLNKIDCDFKLDTNPQKNDLYSILL